jgi:hypothetical protein
MAIPTAAAEMAYDHERLVWLSSASHETELGAVKRILNQVICICQ